MQKVSVDLLGPLKLLHVERGFLLEIGELGMHCLLKGIELF